MPNLKYQPSRLSWICLPGLDLVFLLLPIVLWRTKTKARISHLLKANTENCVLIPPFGLKTFLKKNFFLRFRVPCQPWGNYQLSLHFHIQTLQLLLWLLAEVLELPGLSLLLTKSKDNRVIKNNSSAHRLQSVQSLSQVVHTNTMCLSTGPFQELRALSNMPSGGTPSPLWLFFTHPICSCRCCSVCEFKVTVAIPAPTMAAAAFSPGEQKGMCYFLVCWWYTFFPWVKGPAPLAALPGDGWAQE